MNEPPYLSGLNDPQREAVLTTDGPLLVLAGAGTGKTRALTARLAYILQTGKAFPSQILCVTFTNKAAQEMKHRVSTLLGGTVVDGWWLGTFHALCAKILRRHAPLLGLTSSFTILDSDDQLKLIKQISDGLNIDPKQCPPKLIHSIIERWKDRALLPHDITMNDAGDVANGQMKLIYERYQARLKALNACDFGDLLLHVLTIFKDKQNGVLSDYQRKFKYILVDEYQDTNVAQYLWLRLLAQATQNICCVGDDDQSIYGWRGAEVGNILRFEKDFPAAKIIRLEQNYRSTNHILKAASAVIDHNKGRLGKTLWSAGDDGEKILTKGLWDGDAEARFIAETIELNRSRGAALRSMAILVRAGFLMREFEEKFIQNSIPYRVFGGAKFYERQEVRDALAYLRIIAQPADDLALLRIINLPKRGLGDAALNLFSETARSRGSSLYDALVFLSEASGALKPKIQTSVHEFITQIEKAKSVMDTMRPAALAQLILEESGYLAMWQADKTTEAMGRVDNLKEFISSLESFETLTEFLEHVSLVLDVQDDGNNDDYVSIMTLHGAKGLEFDTVFLPGWEEGLFPSGRSVDDLGLAGLEEERRLAYVGITRARKQAIISYVGSRRIFGQFVNALPSRFITELPADSVEALSADGLSHTGYAPPRSKFYDSSIMPVKKPIITDDEFAIGVRVYHQSFGMGKIINKAGRKLDILFFTDGQTRRIMDNFVSLEARV